jgi:MFS family permease
MRSHPDHARSRRSDDARPAAAQAWAGRPVIARVLLVRGLRAFADGYVSLLLPVYLIALGMSPLQVGVITAGTLFGSGVLTLWIGLQAYRFTYRTLFLAAAMLMTCTGLGFAAFTDFWPLLLIAIVGTLNPSGGDVSLFLPLEHAVLSQSVADRMRTALFARYSLAGTLVGALGTVAAGLPDILVGVTHMSTRSALQSMFVLYGFVGLLSGWIYRGFPAKADMGDHAPQAPLKKSRRVAYTLAALFSLDAFGGGFVVQSLLALWLFQKYQLSAMTVGSIFFWTGILSALSYLVAVRIADRFGLLNTMVFTHLPSSLLLIAIPFVPTPGWAIALLLARSALSQMDVPTRSSFVMALVPPEERAAAASVTSIPRSLAAAISPILTGYLLTMTTFGWPLVLGGGIKIIYDLLLYFRFRGLRPPEEMNGRER